MKQKCDEAIPRLILKAIYYGKIRSYERREALSPERADIESKIREEKAYFKQNTSSDDFQRLETLEDLYTQAA